MTILVVGLGNRYRGDDAVGPAVVDLLSESDVATACGDPMGDVHRWSNYDRVVLVDAMRSGRSTGTIDWVDADQLDPNHGYVSTHSFGPPELIGLARALDLLPARLEVIGVEAETFTVGAAMSPEVTASARSIAQDLRDA